MGSADCDRSNQRAPFPQGWVERNRTSIVGGTIAGVLAGVGLAAVVHSVGAGTPKPAPEVIVYATDLPKGALSEFRFWKEPASPGGRMVGTPNAGGDLDPPPENDPHVSFKVPVQAGVAYRCWVHMKVGKPKGKSQANLFYVQFTDAVDKVNKEMFKPRTGSYLMVRGPAQEGWAWVGRDLADAKSTEPLIYFRASGDVTVRMQAGMEGVGFDQFVLSPARFLERPPSEAIVRK